MSIIGAIEYIQNNLGSLEGIRSAPILPPETINVFPAIVVLPGSGTWEYQTSESFNVNMSLVVQLHIARKNLPQDTEMALKYVKTIPIALLKDPTLGRNIKNFTKLSFSFKPLGWDKDTIGFEWIIENISITEIEDK